MPPNGSRGGDLREKAFLRAARARRGKPAGKNESGLEPARSNAEG